MFPDGSTLFAAPFTDEALYQEQYTKAAFWSQPNFYGVDLNPLKVRVRALVLAQHDQLTMF